MITRVSSIWNVLCLVISLCRIELVLQRATVISNCNGQGCELCPMQCDSVLSGGRLV